MLVGMAGQVWKVGVVYYSKFLVFFRVKGEHLVNRGCLCTGEGGVLGGGGRGRLRT